MPSVREWVTLLIAMAAVYGVSLVATKAEVHWFLVGEGFALLLIFGNQRFRRRG